MPSLGAATPLKRASVPLSQPPHTPAPCTPPTNGRTSWFRDLDQLNGHLERHQHARSRRLQTFWQPPVYRRAEHEFHHVALACLRVGSGRNPALHLSTSHGPARFSCVTMYVWSS